MVADARAWLRGEGHSLGDQPVDRIATVFDDEAGGFCIAQTCSRGQRVPDVRLDRIRLVEDSGDPALRPTACAVFQAAFGHKRDPEAVRQPKGKGLTGQATANDKDVELVHEC